jgi:hypothetical protein
MPISIAGSGTITGISAGGLPDDCITTAEIAANAVTTAKLGSAEQSGLCKAWVNFNGTSTVAIRASYNVSSITDNGTGDYTVNFTTAMVDANYSITGTAMVAVTNAGILFGPYVNAPTTSAVRFLITVSSFAATDSVYASVAIFR